MFAFLKARVPSQVSGGKYTIGSQDGPRTGPTRSGQLVLAERQQGRVAQAALPHPASGGAGKERAVRALFFFEYLAKLATKPGMV